jgi:hypothetical protein
MPEFIPPNVPGSKVGYGRPPQETQFKKGKSGNPSGRPRGKHRFAETLERILSEKVMVKRNKRRQMVTKSEALCRKLVDRALAGDARSLDQLTGLLPHVDEYSPPDVEQRPPTKEELEAKEREFDAKIREIYGLPPAPRRPVAFDGGQNAPQNPYDKDRRCKQL